MSACAFALRLLTYFGKGQPEIHFPLEGQKNNMIFLTGLNISP